MLRVLLPASDALKSRDERKLTREIDAIDLHVRRYGDHGTFMRFTDRSGQARGIRSGLKA